MTTVLLSGIEFYGYHGVSGAERAVGHRFECDVELEVSERASETDDVADTVDYGAVARLIVEVGQGASFRTVERLARVTADRVLAEFPTVRVATVELFKLLPPVPHVIRAAGVRVSVVSSRD